MFMRCILKPEQWWERLLSCQCGQRDNVVQLSAHICISSTTSIRGDRKITLHAIRYGRKTICSLEEVIKRWGVGRETEEHSDGDGDGDGDIRNAFMATPWQKAHLSRRQPNFHLLQPSVLPSSPFSPSYSVKSKASQCLYTELYTNAKLHLLPHLRNISVHPLPTLHTSSHSGNWELDEWMRSGLKERSNIFQMKLI